MMMHCLKVTHVFARNITHVSITATPLYYRAEAAKCLQIKWRDRTFTDTRIEPLFSVRYCSYTCQLMLW